MSNTHPLTATCAALAIAAALTGCGTTKTAATPPTEHPSRDMVIWNWDQTSDLYANGQLNDTKGNRWDVAILPGFYPTMQIAGDSYERSWGYIKNTGVREDGSDGAARLCYRFAWSDCASDFMVGGIGRDYAKTSHDVGDLITEKPFAWMPQVAWRTTWGYLLKPAGRVVFGTLGCVGGTVAGTAAGSVEGVGRTTLAVGDSAIVGTAYPIARMAWHQPAWLFCLTNAEPTMNQDGRWGLRVIDRAKVEAPVAAETPAPQVN